MDKALTICAFEWKLILRSRRASLFIIIYPIAAALLIGRSATSHVLSLTFGLAAVPFLLRGIGARFPEAKPIERHLGRSVAMLPVFILQGALYAGVIALFWPAGVLTIGQVLFAVTVAMFVTLMTGVFADP